MRRWFGAGSVVVVVVVVVVVAIALAGTRSRPRADARDAPSGAAGPGLTAATGLTVRIQSGAPGPRVRSGFLGFSFEFQAIRAYTGTDPAAINPVLVQLIRNLTPGQAPVIRIGGDSTDASWVPTPGVVPPPSVRYRLTPSWLATTATLAHELGARMTMGLNLAANEPALAAAEARAFARVLGPSALAATEIGNEPNIYSKIQILHTLLGAPLYARPRDYGYPAFRREFAAEAAASPAGPMWGPALAVGPTPMPGSWVRTIPDFLRRNPQLPVMTLHRYPLRNCFVAPSSPQYPTVGHLLADYATRGLAASLAPWIAIAHRQHRGLRVDEFNSVACRGKAGVSDAFASALWVTDALFSLVRARVDGVNVHSLPDAAYQLFAFRHRARGWGARVQPVYYGLQLFAQAAPPGSRLLHLTGVATTPGLSVWATRATDGTVRVVLINKSAGADHSITLRPPAGLRAAASIERLAASGVHARSGITLGGRTYGASTTSGRLAPLRTATLGRRGRAFAVSLPRASAALITIAAR